MVRGQPGQRNIGPAAGAGRAPIVYSGASSAACGYHVSTKWIRRGISSRSAASIQANEVMLIGSGVCGLKVRSLILLSVLILLCGCKKAHDVAAVRPQTNPANVLINGELGDGSGDEPDGWHRSLGADPLN